MSFLDSIATEKVGGLRPRAWICADAGFGREELKEYLLERGQALRGDAILKPADLCLKVLSAARGVKTTEESVLGPLARQEILRLLLAESRISRGLPELKRLRRQSTFFKKLDRSIQAGRMSFAHFEEEGVYSDRLLGLNGPSPIRDEIRILSTAYEAWLEGTGVLDLPILLREATRILSEDPPTSLQWPEEIYHFSAQAPESLERGFWESLSRLVKVHRIGPLESLSDNASAPALLDWSSRSWRWEKWHTLDDAAEGLAAAITEGSLDSRDLDGQVILIPDVPALRRTVHRVLKEHGIPLADPRDPTRLRWDEGIKWALLPLEAVARNFERPKTVSWLRAHLNQPELGAWISEINARGIRQGLASYAGGALDSAHSHLSELHAQLGGKKLCSEIAEAHLTYLRAAVGSVSPKAEELQWVLPFFEAIWRDFIEDTARIGQSSRRGQPLYWLERLQARVSEASPPAEKLKPEQGIRIHRLGQAPLRTYQRLWLFGFPPSWFSGEGVGDYWFSERERETLSSEFGVRSGIQVRQERIASFKSWFASVKELVILDAHYDWDGRERQTLLPALRDLGVTAPKTENETETEIFPLEKGCHPRWLPSYSVLRPLSPLEIKLPPLSTLGRRDILATELDHFSRCGFRGLGASRWKLWDVREPGSEPWPEVKGNILHAAVKILLESRSADGSLRSDLQGVLQEAWRLHRPKGLLKGERLERYVKGRLLRVLETFIEKEAEYFKRAGASISSLEGPALKLEYPEFDIVGIPDRVDETEDGIFIMDFKTSSALPKGKEMVEQGYRLQLPFYALAASRKLGKPALGVQFVELNRKGGRTSGIFFQAYNGKEPGKLTHTRAKLSLFDRNPEDVWAECEAQIVSHAHHYVRGEFTVKPKKETECRSCPFDDLCQKRRQGDPGAVEGTPDDGA